jgi:dipeptidyl-peptidase-4
MNALALTLLVATTTLVPPCAAQSTPEVLEQAEERIRAIYERGEWNAPAFSGEWLPDGTRYQVRERAQGSTDAAWVVYDAATGELSLSQPNNADRPGGATSPDAKHSVINQGGTLWIRDAESGKRRQVGRTAVPKAIRTGRAAWSPSGQWLAFVETDQSEVRMRSRLLPVDPTYPEVTEDRFARVGERIAMQRVGIVAAAGGELRWLDLQAPDEGIYLGQVDWAPHSDELLIEKLSRFRNEREFLLADAATGQMQRIFHEADPAWVVASYGKNSGLTWLDDGAAFLVLSEQEGWRQAYVYKRDGSLVSKLTPEAYDIIERAHVDESSGLFYFYASPDHGARKYLYRVPLDGSALPTRVTPKGQPGTHDYNIAPGGKWAFHSYSTFDLPPVTQSTANRTHRPCSMLGGKRRRTTTA